ncbi:MAG TPA: transporter substrate-binding domain-containing protein [Paucimonas sp.]|nr:transporter substrate-binding domain-containing protein [Paucimonas sp.]
MRVIHSLLMACACLFLAAAPFVPALSRAEAPKEVRIGMGLTKPPYIMESGKEGLEYEIAEQALAAAGLKMVGVQFPPVRGLALFRAGQLDGLLTVDEGIGGNHFFSEPYILYQNVATTLTSRNIRLRQIEDLIDYSVAGFQNANVILGERFKALAARHPEYKEYPQQIIQDKLLYTGRVDVVVGDRRIFRYFSTRLEASIDATQPVTFHPIFPPNPRLAAFHDAELRDRFNAGLKAIKSNGAYDAILKKYQEYMRP